LINCPKRVYISLGTNNVKDERYGMNREQKFFNALRDVFVGAKVEGESGYINLMRRRCPTSLANGSSASTPIRWSLMTVMWWTRRIWIGNGSNP
jgi:hypothetical protein